METNERIGQDIGFEHIDRSQLKDYVMSDEGQNKIVGFTEKIRTELGNRSGWEKACEAADKEGPGLNDDVLLKIIDKFEPYISSLPPGHDQGHFKRDLVNAIIISDSIMNTGLQYSESDCLSGILAGAFHDVGTSIIPRYMDRELGAGHAETGAWLFDKLTENILNEDLRKLVVYSISAHTNFQKEVIVKKPKDYIKKPYFDQVWEKDKKLLGLGYKIARMADRLDTNGSVFALRHIMAHFDEKEESNSDFSGGQWFEINEDSLSLVLKPEIRESIPRTPTTLEHVTNFKNSNFGNSIYSEDDYKFPGKFQEVLDFEINNFETMVELMSKEPGKDDDVMELNKIEDLFLKVSKSSKELFKPMWTIFEKYWHKLNNDEQRRWTFGFKFCEEVYKEQLQLYENNITNSNFPETLRKVIDRLKQ